MERLFRKQDGIWKGLRKEKNWELESIVPGKNVYQVLRPTNKSSELEKEEWSTSDREWEWRMDNN